MTGEHPQGLARVLAGLPRGEPGNARADRVRARCRVLLARRVAATRRSTRRARRIHRIAETAAVGGFCIAYLTAILLLALQSLGAY